MASLVSRLHSLVRADGNPDITRRRAELNELISSLLPSEIRLYQQRLKNMTFVRDFIPDLPAEIRLGITNFLDLHDLTTFRSVSKQWYDCWTQVSICNKLMKEHFRSAFENTYMKLPDSEKRLRFMAASDRLQAMRDGHYNSMTILSYDRYVQQDNVPIPIMDRRYSSGRVAWVIAGGIRVSNLRSGAETTYLMPDRDMVLFWALSENLVVAGTPNKAKIHAWQLDGDDMKTARLQRLPSNRIAIQGDRVGVVTSRHEIVLWDFGGSVTQMAIKDPIPEHRGFREMEIIFHPDSIDTVFIIFLSCTKIDEHSEVTGTVQWRVQKYLRGELMATYAIEYPLEGLDYQPGDEPKVVFWICPRKIDDNGTYSIGPVPVDFASGFLDLGCHHHWDRRYRRRGHRQLAHHITFNVYEERLSTTFHHLPGGHKDQDYINFLTPPIIDRPRRENSHRWGGQIFIPVMKLIDPAALADPRDKLPLKRALLMAIKSCDQIVGPPTDVRYIGGYGSPPPTVWEIKGRFPTRDLGVIYCWVGDPHLAQQSDPLTGYGGDERQYMECEIRGDGTFVVLFGEYDYVVWCYDKQLRVQGQE